MGYSKSQELYTAQSKGSSSELGYLIGPTSHIQAQMNDISTQTNEYNSDFDEFIQYMLMFKSVPLIIDLVLMQTRHLASG